jgi:hypothetical protein
LKTFFLGLAVAAASLHASPVLYNFNFTGGTPNATGSFDYDPSPSASSNPFSSFVVIADGFTFNFTSDANGQTSTGCGGSTGPQSVFNALIGDTGTGCGVQAWVADLASPTSVFTLLNSTSYNLHQDTSSGPNSDIFTGGTFTATAAAPEPGTWALFLAGAGTLFSWKRIRRSR